MYKRLNFDARTAPIGDIINLLLQLKGGGVTSLHLRANNLDTKAGKELALAFAAIPESVRSLNLGCNNLGAKTGKELAFAFAKIPKMVTCITLSYDEFKGMNTEQRKAILKRFPNDKNLILLDDNGRKLNAGKFISVANLYRALGVKTDVPPLFNLSAFL